MNRVSLIALAAATALGQTAVAKQTDTSTGSQQGSATSPQSGSQGSVSGAPSGSTQGSAGQKGSAGSTMRGDTSTQSNQVVGSIQKIDKDKKSITIDQAGRTQEMKYTDAATVFMNGRLGGFQDLQEGQQVRAAFDEKSGTKTLRWIEVTPKSGSMQPSNQPTHQGGSMQHQGSDQGAMPDTGSPGDSMDKMKHGSSAMMGGEKTEIVGRVVKADNDKLTLDANGFKWTVEPKKNAPIFIDDQQSSLKVLREGQQVRAALEDKDGTMTLHVHTKM